MNLVKAEDDSTARFMRPRMPSSLLAMADRLSNLRGFLLKEVEKRRSWRKGPDQVPNTAEIARKLGVNQSTIWRIIYGRRNVRDAESRTRPLRQYKPSQELMDGMMRMLGYTTESELLDAIDSTPPVQPLPPPTSSGRR